MNRKPLLFVFCLCWVLTPWHAVWGGSFEQNLVVSEWQLDPGVVAQGGQLVFTGDGAAYLKAQCRVSAEALGHETFFLVGEVKLESVTLGKASFHAPKFKVYHGDDPSVYLANNIQVSGTTGWVPFSLPYKIPRNKPTRTMVFEVALQACAGTLRVRNLKLAQTLSASQPDYPFALPQQVRGRLDIDTTRTIRFNNHLLGANSQFMESKDQGYGSPWVDAAIRQAGLTALRFPGGTVANWYDFLTDRYAIPAQGDQPPKHTLWEKPFGYPNYRALCQRHGLASIHVFNVLYDSPEKSAQRLKSLIQDGLRPLWVELGNENDLQGQQSPEIRTPTAYIEKAKNTAAALKAVDPTIRCAVNTGHENLNENLWAQTLSKEHFFDAVVMHPYTFFGWVSSNGINPFLMAGMLGSYVKLNQYFEGYRNLFGKTPLWVTEWGVIGAPDVIFNPLATLATAGCFFQILEQAEDGLVEVASIHIFFGNFMGLYYSDLKGQLIRRGYAVLFEGLSETFKDAQLFLARSTAPAMAPGLPPVLARAVRRPDGSFHVFAINLCPVEAALTIGIDGRDHHGAWTRRSYFEPDLTKRIEYPMEITPWKTGHGQGDIRLPPFSLSRVILER